MGSLFKPRNSGVCSALQGNPDSGQTKKRTTWFMDFDITGFQSTCTEELSTKKREGGP